MQLKEGEGLQIKMILHRLI